tara:strand:- start:135 stop:614 length:480 start_codon:yes stop_codon:yes gene_type:complete
LGDKFLQVREERPSLRLVFAEVVGILKWEGLFGRNMTFPAQGYPIARVPQIVDDRFGSRVNPGVVRPRARTHGVESGVDIVPGRRAHRSGLKAAVEGKPFLRKLIQVWSFGLSAIDFHIKVGAIVRDHQNDIRAFCGIGYGRSGKNCENSDESRYAERR